VEKNMKYKTRTAGRGDANKKPKWGLGYLEVAEKEARKLLTPEQYTHVVQYNTPGFLDQWIR
jgi:hypothetical protein